MIYKLFLFIFFLFLSGHSYANKIEVFYAQKSMYEKYSPLINKTILYLNKKYSNYHDKNFTVYLDIKPTNKKTPYTQVSETECKVHISLKQDKPIIFNSFQQDLEFLLVHELAHCYYGANHIFERKIDFLIPTQKNIELENYVKSENKHKGCFDCFQEIAFDPFIAYSELLSDIFAIKFFIDTNKEYEDLILRLYDYRNNNFFKTQQNTNYISNIFIENFYLSHNLESLSYIDIQIKAQETLIYFIENRIKK